MLISNIGVTFATRSHRRVQNGGTAIRNSEVCALTTRTSDIQTYSGTYYERN